MAVKNSTAPAPAVRQAATRPSRGANAGAGADWEKADAFINIALPTTGGNRVRVESIKLKLSNVVHEQLITKLSDPALTPEQRQEKLNSLRDMFILEFTLPLTDEQKELVNF